MGESHQSLFFSINEGYLRGRALFLKRNDILKTIFGTRRRKYGTETPNCIDFDLLSIESVQLGGFFGASAEER